MTELETAQLTIKTLYVFAFAGYLLWGIVGWIAGRDFLRRNHIKPNGLINMTNVRKIEEDNFKQKGEIATLKGQIAHYDKENELLSNANKELIEQNKSLWYWNYSPHREAEFITIRQQDKNGDDVATSQIMLPALKDWAYEPVAYADDRAEDFYKWKDEQPHNQN